MLQLTPQLKILVAAEPVDGRKGIDGLAQVCRQKLAEDPFSGAVFIFRTRRATSIKILVFDGQGFFYAQKRLSQGAFRFWPKGSTSSFVLQAHQAQMLLAAGNPLVTAGPVWRAVSPSSQQVPTAGARKTSAWDGSAQPQRNTTLTSTKLAEWSTSLAKGR